MSWLLFEDRRAKDLPSLMNMIGRGVIKARTDCLFADPLHRMRNPRVTGIVISQEQHEQLLSRRGVQI